MNKLPAWGSLLLGLLLAACAGSKPEVMATAPHLAPTVILISLDGFRWDYLHHYEAPTLKRLAAEGVWADSGMVAAFPTKTFPNHYTLVTGLYPAHHGIVGNTMYDPTRDAWFRLSDRAAVSDGRWWGGEPIWVTAERQGQRAATFFWPGSEAEIGGVRPSFWQVFDDDFPGPARIDSLLAWLELPPDRRPTLLTLYYSDVDHAGHRYGPLTPEVGAAVQTVDGYLARLVAGLERRGLLDQVHLVLVADHGMAEVSPDRVLFLEDYLDLDEVTIVDTYPVLLLMPKDGRVDAVFERLEHASPYLTLYRKGALPEAYHFDHHPRIPALVGVVDEGWIVQPSRERFDPNWTRGGAHGYDQRLLSMRALFVARGPRFQQGIRVKPFENVHLYHLLCTLLGLTPAPNDGAPTALNALLKP
jgi:predicted AlkP superfamily pyrophosphatase or phosphodiesterase